MSETTNKPAWVEALDEAQTTLRSAAGAESPEATDSKTRLAYGWMDVARMLKEGSSPSTPGPAGP